MILRRERASFLSCTSTIVTNCHGDVAMSSYSFRDRRRFYTQRPRDRSLTHPLD